MSMDRGVIVGDTSTEAPPASGDAQRGVVSRRAALLLGMLLAGIALLLRFYRLDVQPLWLDEGATWAYVTRSKFTTLLIDLVRPTQAYPLFYLLVKFVTRLFGDSEWALRLPSALTGALAVPAMVGLGRELRGWTLGLVAGLLLLVSPFAIWQSQDAKTYSLTLLVAILLAWTLVRALRLNTRSSWLSFIAIAFIAPFVHRLLVFTLLGCVITWSLTTTHPRGRMVLFGASGLGIAVSLALALSLRYQDAAQQYIAVNPITAFWLTFSQFAVNQGPETLGRWWLLPFGLLTMIGMLRLGYAVRQRYAPSALMILVLGLFPTLLFALGLLIQPLFEARYFTIVFPFWLLTLAWAMPELEAAKVRPREDQAGLLHSNRIGLLSAFLIVCTVGISCWALVLPTKGIFSGDIVKEDYRGAVGELAKHVHPDDLVIVHPDGMLQLYEYYAPRVSNHSLPQPVTYSWLGRTENDQARELRELDVRIRADLGKAERAWLLVAPEHARVLDPPRVAGDTLGLVGLAFQYGDQNGRLQCGVPHNERAYAGFVGILLYCNNMPRVNGAIPQPEVALTAVFGDALKLRGYTITPFATGIHPGGTLPITLFWEPIRSLEGTDYVVFVHLTTPDDPKPLAQFDGRPLEGGLPTGLWTTPGEPIHDERTMLLIDEDGAAVPPGRYVLRLGVYDAQTGERLPVSETQQPVTARMVLLGDVDIQAQGAAGQ